MKWYCKKCKEFSDEEDLIEKEYIEETYGPYRRVVYEHFCPECGSEEVVEAGRCEMCGEPCDPRDDFCESCHDEANYVMDKMATEYGVRKDIIQDLMCECM